MKKIILITTISDNGPDARYAFGNNGRWFAQKYISEDSGKTFVNLPTFPTDSRLDSLKKKNWYNNIGEFVFFGNNKKDVLANMSPTNRNKLVYRIADADIGDNPCNYLQKI